MRLIQIAGIILLFLGLAAATGASENYWQAPMAAAMLLVGGAWVQGMTVRDFVHRILSGDREPTKYGSIGRRNDVKKAA